ncbi:hypothetical protein LJR129_002830 [Acidovorax sp. LjRoot129]|uniref:hypothetical protein n=1 Tax=Acidovorax sp. LjRoot129 TaxID=3342260 RepID=UPI003ED162D5
MKHAFVYAFASFVLCSVVHAGTTESGKTDVIAERTTVKKYGVRNELAAHKWVLHQIVGPAGETVADWPKWTEGREVALTFDRVGRMFGGVCNFITWQYSLGPKRDFNASQQFMTYAGCPSAALTLEELQIRQMAMANTLRLVAAQGLPPLLVIGIADGSRWEFFGLPSSN